MDGQALVVGASSEIGAAIAAALVPFSPHIVLWGRDQTRLDRAAAGCGGVETSTRVVDVTDDRAMAAGLADVRAHGSLQTVVWAAGLFDWAAADEADADRWRALTEVNLTAPTVFTAMVLPDLMAAAPAALVFIGSGAGHVSYPNNAAYVATKHGLVALARATYLDVRRHRVKVSVVSPGLVAAGATLGAPMTAQQKEQLLRPEDVASAVAYVVGFPDRGCPTEIQLQPHLAL
ncbi:MAG: SDR family NAD(P)-dependent oxidoreductase [Propionibacteriaceae bacterium]